ncbi:hypothetical protein QBC40DRAFT_348771 [Triangularia verruculosa]|uniref:Uncharacterized protein n=1 Tax=Triangularia verruculosa TaxID=2587418 RepID=A0AAN6XHE9_9PEZI|nr:hypothetical protein QBC40DRAFT_348771 [Triangularia verruculosa]
MAGGQDESGALEGHAAPTMGTMSSARRLVRGPGDRGPRNVYEMRRDYDPWLLGRISWTKAGQEKLNKLLRTITQPPSNGFWRTVSGPNVPTEKIIYGWFEEHEKNNTSSAEVLAFRSLIRAYDNAMSGWTNTLDSGASLNKQMTQERELVERLRQETQTLTGECARLEDLQRRDQVFIDDLEEKNAEKADKIADLEQEQKNKQAEIRRLTLTLKSQRSQQTTPGGTVIEGGRHRATFSEDIALRERDEYLNEIEASHKKIDALEDENKSLRDKIERLRSGRDPIDQAGDSVTSTGASTSAGATALKATEQKYQDIIEELETRIGGLERTNTGLETTLAGVTTGSDETLKRERERLQADIVALREQLSSQRSEMSGKIHSLTRKLKELGDRYDICKNRSKDYEKKIRRLEISGDNIISHINRQFDRLEKTIEKCAEKCTPNLNRVNQWIAQVSAASSRISGMCEEAQALATRGIEELKNNPTPSLEFVNDIGSSLANVSHSSEGFSNNLERTLRKIKGLGGKTRLRLEQLDQANRDILETRSRFQSGLVTPTKLGHELDQHAARVEFIRQQLEHDPDSSDDSDTEVPIERFEQTSPPTRPRGEQPPPSEPVDTEQADQATDTAGPAEESSSPRPTQPQPKTPPNRSTDKHEVAMSEKDHGDAGDASQSSEPSSPVFDPDVDPGRLLLLRAYLRVRDIIRGVLDEDRRKSDNSFLGPLVRAARPEVEAILEELFAEAGDPPQDIVDEGAVDRNPEYLNHKYFWLCWVYDQLARFRNSDFSDPNLPITTDMGLLPWLDQCEEALTKQIKKLAVSPEWQQHLVEEFERVFVKDASERHEEATELRGKYDKLEAELLEVPLKPVEEYYVYSCVKRHLDSGKGGDDLEGLVMQIAPTIDREYKLAGVTEELERWIKDHEAWAADMTPPYIEPLAKLESRLRKKIADENDHDDKSRLRSRLRRVKEILRNRPMSELLLGNTVKSPLEVIWFNIQTNQDAVDDQYAGRRQRIEALIREKVFQLYTSNSHSTHAEAACFCSLLKYFMPKVYYGALHDGCCGHGRMVSPVKDGPNVDVQPPRPLGGSSPATRSGRICQGHHGHGRLSASATIVTVGCHILTAILWLAFFLASQPLEVLGSLLMVFTTPSDILRYALLWFRYFFSYLHWRFLPKNYAENYYPDTFASAPRPRRATTDTAVPGAFPDTPARQPGTSDGGSPSISQIDGGNEGGDGGGDNTTGDEPAPERRPSIDIFAPSPPADQAEAEDEDDDDDDDTPWPPPPERPPHFTLSRQVSSPASLIIHLSVITTVITSIAYLAVDQERRIWLSNNHWRRAFVNDLLEPFGKHDERVRGWVDWGVLAFPVNAILRAWNRFFVHVLWKNFSVVPWNTDRAVGSGTAGGYGGITWGERAGLGGEGGLGGTGRVGQSQAAGL